MVQQPTGRNGGEVLRLQPRPDPEAPAPLSYGQQRLWFLQQLQPENLAYNTSRSLRIRGRLDVNALCQAFDAMTARHEILRTTYETRAGQPVQIVHGATPFSLPVIDLRNLPVEDRTNAFQERYRMEGARPFDLSREFSQRAWLYRLDEEEHILVRETHHIASDLWSNGIFNRELSEYYGAFSQGRSPDLPPLPVQYADYAVWQRQKLETESSRQHLDYWRSQLQDPTPLELPLDRPRPLQQTFNGERIERVLPPELVAGLRETGVRERATLYMVMLTALKILLSRLSGQREVVVGSPIAGRTATELEPLIGIFLNSIVLRSPVAEDIPFLELLRQIRRTALEAFTHQEVPFEKILESLQPERDLSRTPYFQVFFNMLNIETEPAEQFPGLETEPLELRKEHAIFDLTVYIRSKAGEQTISFVYNPDLFNQARMQAMLDQYLDLLQQAAANPAQLVSDFRLIPQAHAARLPRPDQPLSTAWQGSIQDRLADWANRTPDRPAVIAGNGALTYRELDDRSNRLATALLAAGLTKGETAAILAVRSPALVIALLGVLKAGAAFTILDPAYPDPRLIAILEQAKPRVFISLAEPSEALGAFLSENAGMRRFNLAGDDPEIPGSRDTQPGVVVGPDDIAVIGFTSGSEGRQKGVLGRHGPLTHFNPWMQERFGLGPDDRFSMLSGLAHDPLQRDIFTALWNGAAICVPEAEVIETTGALSAWMAQAGITFAHLTPAMGQLLTTGETPDLPLRWAFFVGDRLTRSEAAKLRSIAPQAGIINAYGSTETQRAVSMNVIPAGGTLPAGQEVLSLGSGIPDAQLIVRRPGGELCGIGELGEIYMRSPHLAAGYLSDDQLTREKFTGTGPDRMYRTGDLGRYDPDGTVSFAGRSDRQVKVRGYRVEPAEIERVLAAHPEVREAGVVFRQDLPAGPGLAAYLVPSVPKDIRQFLRARLPVYMQPAGYKALDRLPLTPNGKLAEKLLPAIGSRDMAEEAKSLPPQDRFEAGVAAELEALMGIPEIGRQANFFDLGGHSLLAIRLFSNLEKRFGVRLPLSTLFRHPTVAGLAALLRGDDDRHWDIVVPIQSQGSFPPFFCIHGFGGGVVGYAELSRLLGEDQPFYGLQARGMDGEDEPDVAVETMAARYIEAMRTVQPQGPYRMGGYCYGGVVAFEMARQLEAHGEQVEIVAILEGYAPLRGTSREKIWNSPRLLRQYLRNIPFWWRDFVSLGLKGMWGRSRRASRQLYRRMLAKLGIEAPVNLRNIIDEDVVHIPETHRRLMEIHVRAMMDYQPGTYSGRIDLFRVPGRSLTRTPDPKNGWEKLTNKEVIVHMVEGQHNNILEPPHVQSLAMELGRLLRL